MRVSIDLQHLELSDFKMFASIMGENLYLTKFDLHFPDNKSGTCIYTFIVNCIFSFVNCLFIYLSSFLLGHLFLIHSTTLDKYVLNINFLLVLWVADIITEFEFSFNVIFFNGIFW